MHGNTPYAGRPGSTGAGRPNGEDVELTPAQRRTLRDDVSRIAALTREYLPSEYIVGSEVTAGLYGVQATISVQPPVGNPVSAGFTPDVDEVEAGFEESDEREVARGLAASAALQVKLALGDDVTPTAR